MYDNNINNILDGLYIGALFSYRDAHTGWMKNNILYWKTIAEALYYNIKPEHIRLLHNIILLDLTFSTLWFRCPESPLFPSRLFCRWSLRRTFRLDVPCSQPIGLRKKLPCKHIRFVSCRFKLYRLYVYALQLRLKIIFKPTNLYFISIIDSIIPLHPRDPSTIVAFHLDRLGGIIFDITYIKGLCIYRVYYCVVNNTSMLTNILLYGYRILISLRLFAICNICFHYRYILCYNTVTLICIPYG